METIKVGQISCLNSNQTNNHNQLSIYQWLISCYNKANYKKSMNYSESTRKIAKDYRKSIHQCIQCSIIWHTTFTRLSKIIKNFMSMHCNTWHIHPMQKCYKSKKYNYPMKWLLPYQYHQISTTSVNSSNNLFWSV